MAREFRLHPSASAELEDELMRRGGRRVGVEIKFLCPSHPDTNPSASYNTVKHVWTCRVCREGGGYYSLTEALGWD